METQAHTRTESVYDHIQKENQKIMDDFIEARMMEANISKNSQQLRNTLRYLSRHARKNFKEQVH